MNLLKIEWRKVATYRTFWILSILYVVFMGLATFGVRALILEIAEDLPKTQTMGAKITSIPLYHFADVWQNVAFIAKWFSPFLAIILIINVGNEFEYKTLRQSVINGLSRWDVLKSKLLNIGVLSLFSTFLVFLFSLILALIDSNSLGNDLKHFWTSFEFLGGFFLQTFFYLCFALFVTILIKRSGFAIAIVVFYTFVMENIICGIIPDRWAESLGFSIESFLPMRAIYHILECPFPRYIFKPPPESLELQPILLASLYCILFIFWCNRLIHKRDI